MEQKRKKKLRWWHWVLILLIIGGIGSAIEDSLRSPEDKADIELSKNRNDSLNTVYIFSKNLLIKGLKDPESYDEVEVKKYFVINEGKKNTPYIQVLINYRATNSFGGTIQSGQYFDFDKNLSLIETYEKQ